MADGFTAHEISDEPGGSHGLGRGRLADGIYGTIITASVLVSAGDELATLPLALSVLMTLVVYWLADVYAQLLAGPHKRGSLPTWHEASIALVDTWPLVSASFSPLALLLVAWLLGARSSVAATVALVGSILMLIIYSRAAARAAKLRGFQVAAVTAVAAMIGVLMIALKNVVLVHLH